MIDWGIFDDGSIPGQITTLCGSTRFLEVFDQANLLETLRGRIVLTISCNTKSDEALGLSEAVKYDLDRLHLRKIELAQRVLILNVGGYIGDSTFREMVYAMFLRKRIMFWEAPDKNSLLRRIGEEQQSGPHYMIRDAYQTVYHEELRVYPRG